MKLRFIIPVILFFVVIVGINLWQYFSSNSEQAEQHQVDQLGNTLLAQNGQLLISYIQQDQQHEIKVLLDSLAQLEIVHSSALYLPDGTPRYATQNDQAVSQLRQQSPMPLIYVHPLFQNETLLGFVKLVLDRKEVTAHLHEFNQVGQNIGWILFVLGVLCAYLVMSVFYQTRGKN